MFYVHLIVYGKKVYVYVCIDMCINAGFQQHRTTSLSETRISQDTPASRTKRGGEPIQQAISGLAMV
jgi:hypothetical protein